MSKQGVNNIKLGLFVISGIVILAVSLYMIGTQQNMFTSNFRLKARFRNVEGLMPGNNVRYSGIQTGTVKSVEIIDDTTIEVTMYINKTSRQYIRKNSLVSIGNEGLMGNKVINITPNKIPAEQVTEGYVLTSTSQVSITDAMGTLYKTTDNASLISEELLFTIRKINSSPAIWGLLADSSLPADLHATVVNIRESSGNIKTAALQLQQMVANIQKGKGAAGVLLADSAAGAGMALTISNIHTASQQANQLIERLDSISGVLHYGISNKQGAVNMLLYDTTLTGQLSRSMSNIEQGTAAFNEDMEALKHNFLTRKYFRKKNNK